MLDCDYCAILCTFSLFTCHVDVIQSLTHQLDAEWREFGTFLHVDPPFMDKIDNNRTSVGACMLQLVEDWVGHKYRIGDLSCT